MADAIDWSTASRVARTIARGHDLSSTEWSRLESEFMDHTARAQELVEAHTGWQSTAGPARARLVDREQWVDANVRSFRRLLKPLVDRLEQRMIPGPAAWISARVAGAELGAMLGWMSSRVLGQYDLLVLDETERDDQDVVYFVGPNIVQLERRLRFDPKQFHLWVALHEVTHRTQFTAQPWIRGYFLEQVSTMMELADPDPQRFFTAIGRIAEGLRLRQNPLNDAGLMGLFASAEQLKTMNRVGGLMSLLEGHGDITMDRAGGTLIPDALKFSEALSARRSQQNAPTRLIYKLLGLEAKLNQYIQGEQFLEAIEAHGGAAAVNLAFASVDTVPTLDEIRQPTMWLQRLQQPLLAR